MVLKISTDLECCLLLAVYKKTELTSRLISHTKILGRRSEQHNRVSKYYWSLT